MLKLWKFTLFFVLCLVVALLFNLPIQQVLPHVQLPSTLRLAGIDGTLVRGTADEVVINDFPVRDVRYRYMPSCIAMLKVCYKITYAKGDVQAAYDVLNGDTEITRTVIEYQASELAHYLPNAVMRPVGRLELTIDEMIMVAGKTTALNGKLVMRDLGLDDEGIKLNIGDFQIDFTGDPKQYDFKLQDVESSLDVDGKGEIRANGQYKLDIKIESEGTIDPNIKSVLSLIAANQGYNKYRVEQTGRLPPNLIKQLFR